MKFNTPFIAFSAPSGAGKTTIVKNLAQKYQQLVISVSATTREIRPNETEGKDYFFLTEEVFKKSIIENAFLEYENVHGQYYGTLIKTVDNFHKQSKIVLFDIDVNGALAVKKYYPEALLIFIKPPSTDELIKRLNGRKSETEASIQKRLERLEFEYTQAEFFDHIIINDDFDAAIKEIESIIIDS